MERSHGAIRTVEQFARGIVDVANAVMEKAIRVISVERGHDPRDYALVAFGGAGGLHACDLASALRIPRVIIPRLPGGLSALGILRADVVHDYSRTVRHIVDSVQSTRRVLASEFARLEASGRSILRDEGFRGPQVRVERLLDMRYSGQAYELMVPESGDFLAAFHRAHEQRYGYSDAARKVEVVNVRTRLIGMTPKPKLDRLPRAKQLTKTAPVESRLAFFAGRRMKTRIYDRAALSPSDKITAPAIISEYSATTVVPPGWLGIVDPWGNIILRQTR
jgi:N-methylhydantoinase A